MLQDSDALGNSETKVQKQTESLNHHKENHTKASTIYLSLLCEWKWNLHCVWGIYGLGSILAQLAASYLTNTISRTYSQKMKFQITQKIAAHHQT